MTTLYTAFLLFVALVRPLHMLGRWGKRRRRERVIEKFNQMTGGRNAGQ